MMKKPEPDYFEQSQGWEKSRTLEMMKSNRTAWIVAASAGVTTLLALLAIVIMMPLKQTEPYVIRVDNNTGTTDVVSVLSDTKTTQSEALNKFFVQRYVRFRESYSSELAEDYYNYVGLMSSSAEATKYGEWFSPKNPNSPLNVYNTVAKVKIDLQSVSPMNDSVYIVRFIRKVERGAAVDVSHWVATVTFKYSAGKMTEKERGVNPLGFLVTDYRIDPDSAVEQGKRSPQLGTVPALPALPGNSSPPPGAVSTLASPVAPISAPVPAIK